MNDTTERAAAAISEGALDVLFRTARSYNAFEPGTISDATLRALYELMKWGPTTANSQPQRILFLRSQAAKNRLAPALTKTNLDKTIAAPVVAILAFDLKFYEHLLRMYHNPAARSWYETTPEHIHTTSFRNATLQGAYFIMAARALGLDAGPMSGFDNAKVDAEFFPDGQWKSNFLCILGKGEPGSVPPRNPRFAFDEVCRIL
ncbi:MAG TPA: malonic semialdehyde reductase [Xanthobacteraceae bacterium]|jgi:3-hydroxypropanoate dehydrogenase|nr:malonic semialdehyde reductase [Xanthobacteraceae bacterium]